MESKGRKWLGIIISIIVIVGVAYSRYRRYEAKVRPHPWSNSGFALSWAPHPTGRFRPPRQNPSLEYLIFPTLSAAAFVLSLDSHFRPAFPLGQQGTPNKNQA